MTYFTLNDHQRLAYGAQTTQDDDALQLIYDKFMELHTALHSRLRDHNYELHPHPERAAIISSHSITGSDESQTLALTYFRSREQALLVERLMGRDGRGWKGDVEVSRHPVIELRLTPGHFAVELVVSPDAWWDQQNLIGKLGIQRHREAFRALLSRMNGDFRLGFWKGADLGDMHLTTRQLVRGNNLYEWMSTFADGQDWLRVGVWYEPEDPQLETNRILRELVERVGALYSLYTFLVWTSNNDFHSFYQKLSIRTPNLRLA